jgi:hypothetical protein
MVVGAVLQGCKYEHTKPASKKVYSKLIRITAPRQNLDPISAVPDASVWFLYYTGIKAKGGYETQAKEKLFSDADISHF